jgi:hypothetical protein
MKNILRILFTIASAGDVFAQTTEYSVQVGSGLFSYGGKSAASATSVSISDVSSLPHDVHHVFGKKSGLSYGIYAQMQTITKKNYIRGVRLGFNRLSSKANVTSFANMVGYGPADGKVIASSQVVQLNPYFGYRIQIKKMHVDLTGGINGGYILTNRYHLTVEGRNYAIDQKEPNQMSNTKFDFGPGAGVSIGYRKIALSADYFHGLVNYLGEFDAANREIYSRYLRFGISYQIF